MEAELRTGAHGDYRTLDWNTGCDVNLGTIVRQLPQVVMGRYVAIAWSDSAQYNLSAAEIELGWECVGDLVLSPLITDIAQLPTPGFDEWHIFERMPDWTKLSKFRRAIAFQPFADGVEADEFWSQIEELQPEHALLGACPSLLLITRDEAIYERTLALCTASAFSIDGW
ncbi:MULTISPECIES: hypothetical protein [unclassified Pseudomonas]|uniref:hypothetical protein n=1 Tax=unclassified Pseudomonas TaxID=196821 RepID=UPI000A1D9314|nr:MULTISPECIES: hypothetical protein [unclassified Pseudomonas]